MTDDMEDLQVTYPGAGTFRFGDNATLCAELLTLVRSGAKTATCEAASVFADEPEALPKVGRCDIAANWDGTPALVIRTTSVERVRFGDVTEAMALAEGENTSLAGWRRDHEAYFTRTSGFSPDMELVFEHFELVEDLADR
ncbi:ASCH domain-containing protein [Pseudooceanicola sp.]|uniref:ASCH domain-containing protein n=1 Tax=Pseudooceanicola sp. TaxID=1914328 RepID=UPI00261109EC|nr:ASCH domain-containing protein [Pseudooceanicola sp.]MDF1854611.1 ASCH domain-containing protein [Pseudooceanicola sp.]